MVESRSMVRGESPGPAPSGPGPRQQLAAHAVELTDMPPPEAAQEGPRVDGALTTQPRTPTVPPARSASASSMQSPPASAEATSVSILSPVFRPSRRSAEVKVMVDEFPQAPGAGLGWPAGAGRHWPPGDGRQRECGYGRVCSVAASIGCSLFPGGFLFQNHYPRFRGAPAGFFKGCPQGRPSVDSGLAASPAP